MRTVYLVGLSGSGKTTVVNLALQLLDLQPVVEHLTPIPHVRHGTLWHLGRHRDPFGGTDTLAMNINPKAIDWVTVLACIDRILAGLEINPDVFASTLPDDKQIPAVLLGEGDRLANNKFLAACPNLTLVWLDTPIPQARQQAAARAAAHGQPEQNHSWWKGRVTKVNNLINSRPTVRLDGTRPLVESAADLAVLLAP